MVPTRDLCHYTHVLLMFISWPVWCGVLLVNGRSGFPGFLFRWFLAFKGVVYAATLVCLQWQKITGRAEHFVFTVSFYMDSLVELAFVCICQYVVLHVVVNPVGDYCSWREFGTWFGLQLSFACVVFVWTGCKCRERSSHSVVPRVQGSMPPELLQWIPLRMLSDADLTHRNNSCVICLIDFEPGHCVRDLFCGHRFHQECVDQWLAVCSVCPLRCCVALQATALCSAQGRPKTVYCDERHMELTETLGRQGTV